MGVRHSLQTPRMEHTFIIKTTTCCICSIVCLYYFLQLENNGKIMKERMPWWHDEWTVKMTISFVETSRLFTFSPDKTSNLCNHLFPTGCTQDHFRSYADLNTSWGSNSRVTCCVSSSTRLSVTSCNAANASILRRTLRHTPLHLKVTVSIPDIAICIAVHSMNASLSQGNNSCSLLTKCKCKG